MSKESQMSGNENVNKFSEFGDGCMRLCNRAQGGDEGVSDKFITSKVT